MESDHLKIDLNLESSILFQTATDTTLCNVESNNYNNQQLSEKFVKETEPLIFNSSNGVKLVLKKKQQKEVSQDNSMFDNENLTIWKDDETYGININELLNRIESNKKSDISNISDVDNEPDEGRKNNTNALWVEKWKPQKFIDLVGNESTNRRILFWLRQWTPVVFKEELPSRITPFKNFKGKENPESQFPEDPFQRPFKRILLIHGSPGIGKTSVAHIIAKQQGYYVNEINASDARSGISVKEKIHNDLFSNTFEKKPICLIADEIDGSLENGFIKILLDILRNDKTATYYYLSNFDKINRRHYKDDKANSQIRKKLKNLLMRPIICICNNLYSSSLEKLRPFCEIIAFKKPAENSILERLSYIMEKESISPGRKKIDVESLKTIIDSSQNDLRNCINNLQFFSLNNRDSHKLTLTDTGNISKDFKSSWFKLVNEIFQKDSQSSGKSQFKHLMEKIEVNGSLDKIINGCFSIYLQVKYTDNGLLKPSKISDWLYFNDIVDRSLYDSSINNAGELQRYNTIVSLKFFDFFSDIGNKKDIRIKNHDFELNQNIKSNVEIVNSLMSRVATRNPSLAAFLNKSILMFEVLPALDTIISNDLSKLNNNTIKAKVYKNIIDILNSYQLLLNQTSVANVLSPQMLLSDNENNKDFHLNSIDINKQILAIDPPINKVVLFDTKSAVNIVTKRPQTLNLLLAKVEETKAKKRHLDSLKTQDSLLTEAKNKKQRLQGDQVLSTTASTSTSSSSTIDFFKLQYHSMNSKNSKNMEDSSTFQAPAMSSVDGSKEQSIRIWVKYKEGFSNAVRKNVNWDSFWE